MFNTEYIFWQIKLVNPTYIMRALVSGLLLETNLAIKPSL